MKRNRRFLRIWAALLAAGLMLPATAQKNDRGEVLFEAGKQKELVDGNLPAAIEDYKKILADNAGNRPLAAQVLLQLGGCYDKLGRSEARQAYERVIVDYSDQTEAVAQARRRLASDPGAQANPPRRLVWVDRNGAATALPGPPRDYGDPALSPDGRRVAVGIRNQGRSDIWLYDLVRGVVTRLTFQPTDNRSPLWTPDGKRVVFESSQPGRAVIQWLPADGSGPTEPLLAGMQVSRPGSWTPDGKMLVFAQGPIGRVDIWVLPVSEGRTGDRKPYALLKTEFVEAQPSLSPDGRWLAYMSNESGRREVYMQPFPAGPGKWQISNNGGSYPRWRADGKELFYQSGDRMMSVAVVTSATGVNAGAPKPLFEGRYDPGYDVAPDGQRFLMVKSE